MAINFKKIGGLLIKVLGRIVEGINVVEVIMNLAKGKDKQDAVVELMKQALKEIEERTGKNLVNDEEIEEASRKVIDAIVAFNNLIAKKSE